MSHILSRARAQSAAVALLFIVQLAMPAHATITCTGSAGPAGSETSVTLTIDSPAQGEVLTACSKTATVSGTWATSMPPENYDFYLVLDRSGSTDSSSGADVNGDGVVSGAADSIWRAEIAAARAYLQALPPAQSRVALITFDSTAILWQPLTADLNAALAALDLIAATGPTGSTYYVRAMDAVEAQVTTLGDPTRNQRCDFLSDGAPGESLAQTDAAATSLASRGVVIDTFALGTLPTQVPLQNMASLSGGTFTALAVPGDIVQALPRMLSGITSFTYATSAGATGPVLADLDGTFAVDVPIAPGANNVALTIVVGDSNVVTLDCAVDFSTGEMSVPEAGPAQSACRGATIRLDGSASLTNCPSPLYRWLDCSGAEACPPSASPTCDVVAGTCTSYTLEASCAGGACVLTDVTTVTAITPPPTPVPTVTRSCDLVTLLSCGASGSNWRWDVDTRVDSNGDGDAASDPDLSGCNVTLTLPAPGQLNLRVFYASGACITSATIVVDVIDSPAIDANAGPDLGACSGDPVLLDATRSTSASGGLLYRWTDCAGAEVCAPSPSPTCLAPASTCSYYDLTIVPLEAPACNDTDRVSISRVTAPNPVPAVVDSCVLPMQLSCGSTSTAPTWGWDLDVAADSNGNGDPLDDPDAAGCLLTLPSLPAGEYTYASWGRRGTNCVRSVPLTFTVVDPQVAVANPGPPITGCRDSSVVLDGSGSWASAGTLSYRWLTCSRAVACDWSDDPTCAVTCNASCPTYILQVQSSAMPGCIDEQALPVTCVAAPPALAPTTTLPCTTGPARGTCGGAEPGTTYGWDVEPGVDADGSGDPGDDPDVLGCDADIPLPGPGRWTVVAWARRSECVAQRELDIDFWPPDVRNLDGGACSGDTLMLSCGVPGALSAWWDADMTVDADNDGDFENDADLSGCDVPVTPVDGMLELRGWVEEIAGCIRLVASGTIAVGSGGVPAEVSGLRVQQRLGAGDDLAAWMAWDPTVDAGLYRVLRGEIDTLWTTRAYDHRADPALGIGSCSVPAESFSAVGELGQPGSFYYLVTAVTPCGFEGPTGFAWSPAASPARPARLPTASCP